MEELRDLFAPLIGRSIVTGLGGRFSSAGFNLEMEAQNELCICTVWVLSFGGVSGVGVVGRVGERAGDFTAAEFGGYEFGGADGSQRLGNADDHGVFGSG